MTPISAVPGHSYLAPAPFTALRINEQFIVAGSQDGSVRIYGTSDTKVLKAIRGLGYEVSSITFAHDNPNNIWIAAGHMIYAFTLDTATLVLTADNALSKEMILKNVEDDDNVLNEIAINKTHLVFTCDDGRVGSLDIASHEVKFMRPQHKSVAGPVTFIPNRPREIISGGYDCTLLHTDYQLGSFISSLDHNNGTTVVDSSSVPPFIHALHVSPDGRVVCGLADGRIWLGEGGVKKQGMGKVKKWDGLNAKQSRFINVATGPVVGVAFRDENSVFTSSLGGTLKLIPTGDAAVSDDNALWTVNAASISKVNALVYDTGTGRLVVAGLTRAGKGVLETWTF